jgi:hypothetical protein
MTMTQKAALHKYLKTHKRITVWTAMADLRVLRLSERVRELEADGVKIKRQWLAKDARRVMAYSLA